MGRRLLLRRRPSCRRHSTRRKRRSKDRTRPGPGARQRSTVDFRRMTCVVAASAPASRSINGATHGRGRSPHPHASGGGQSMRKACVLIDETSLMDDGVNCDVEPRDTDAASARLSATPFWWTCVYVLFDGFGARLDADFDAGEHLNLRLPAKRRRRLAKSFRSRFGKTVLMKK